mmetsp:Transcript_84354/g.188561  ORF Transcript_84354/g.188561 Transcript_84354/m.188561 type:complete len:248 (+) Transcript_84354:825-1568(+)
MRFCASLNALGKSSVSPTARRARLRRTPAANSSRLPPRLKTSKTSSPWPPPVVAVKRPRERATPWANSRCAQGKPSKRWASPGPSDSSSPRMRAASSPSRKRSIPWPIGPHQSPSSLATSSIALRSARRAAANSRPSSGPRRASSSRRRRLNSSEPSGADASWASAGRASGSNFFCGLTLLTGVGVAEEDLRRPAALLDTVEASSAAPKPRPAGRLRRPPPLLSPVLPRLDGREVPPGPSKPSLPLA